MLASRTFAHSNSLEYVPKFYRLLQKSDKQDLENLLASNSSIQAHDHITHQVSELIKLRHPATRLSKDELQIKLQSYLGDKPEEYGVWVYYPWLNKIVHLLDREEFIEVRTNRNKYKISEQEQQLLSTKKIGVIGLSVGQSVSLTMAMERTCGEIRLADFDSLDLSNLNRLRTGVHNLGLPKVIISAREIAEIDPYIHVICYLDGITETNIESFFTHNGKLDILIEECDSLSVKILSRTIAKKHKIPVLMETSDRGMLDVERFDLEENRKIFHGLIDQFDLSNLDSIDDQTKMQLLMALTSYENISDKMKYSMSQIGKTINTWPQLASSVVLGGAVTTDIARRILLNHHNQSGRYYVDLEALI
jgi:molybdopterin/thiamine biosynthesis adenylyltransferase